MADISLPPWIERPTVLLDGGLPLKVRFRHIENEVKQRAMELLAALRSEMPAEARKLVTPIRVRTLNRFQKEIVALSKTIDADWRDVLLANVSYDHVIASYGCSTVALPTKTGPVLARNMDWWPEDVLARASYIMRTETDGQLTYANAGWPGAVGVVTGLSGNGFAIALNAVIGPDNFDRQGYPVLLHLRRVIDDAADFDEAVQQLAEQRLTCPALFTVVGTENHQRVVIERAPNAHAFRWGEDGRVLVTTNDYRNLFQTETHEDVGEIYETTCTRYDSLCRFFTDVDPEGDIADERLLYALTAPEILQGITAQHIILRPRTESVRLFVPRRFFETTENAP